MSLRRLFCAVSTVVLLGAPALAAPAPPKSVELYAMDCGRLAIANADMFADDGAYKGVAKNMVVPCYLIRHPKGDLVWDTGLPQADYAKHEGQTSFCFVVPQFPCY